MVAKEDISIIKYQSALEMLKDMGTPDIGSIETESGEKPEFPEYKSRWSAGQFLTALNEVAEADIKEKLESSPYITVLADESTDVAVRKKLIIYAQMTDPSLLTPSTMFISDVTLTEGTGK